MTHLSDQRYRVGPIMGPSAHCHCSIAEANLRLRNPRLSTTRKCPHMLRSDQRRPRNGDLKLMWWWWVVGVQGKGCNSFSLADHIHLLSVLVNTSYCNGMESDFDVSPVVNYNSTTIVGSIKF